MADKPLSQEPDLARGEEETAFMGFVSQGGLAGRVRKLLIAKFAEVLHRRNPHVLVQEPVTIFESSTGVLDSDFSQTYNLDYKSGSSGPRHNFTNGYSFFEFYFQRNRNTAFINNGQAPELISASAVLNATESDSLQLLNFGRGDNVAYLNRFAKNTDTSFKLAGISTFDRGAVNSGLLTKIVGIKLTSTPSSLV